VHKQLVRYDFQGNAGKPCARLENADWSPGMVTDAFALQGLEEQGHLPVNSANFDPYVDDARRLLNNISRHLFVMNSQTKGDGVAFPILDSDSVDPVTGLKDGLMMGTFEDHYEYEMGVILKAIINAGVGAQKPAFVDEALNITGDPAKSVANYTYDQIAQNIIDFIAWAQLYDHPNDYNVYVDVAGVRTFVGPSKNLGVALNPQSRGSWNYWAEGWNDPVTGLRGGWGDMALAFWNTLGLQEAKAKGIFTIPSFLDAELALFVDPAAGHQVLDTADPNYGSVYFGPNDGVNFHNSYHLVERAAELLVVLNYLGVPQDETRAAAALGFINRNWNNHTYDIGQDHRTGGPVIDGGAPSRSIPFGVVLDSYTNGSYWAPRWEWSDGVQGGNYSFFHLYENDGTGVIWGFEEGTYVDGVWTPTKTGDDLNIFAFYAVSRALNGYGITDFPSAGNDPEGLSWEQRITKLLATNQLPDGGYNEFNWVSGSPFGTPWALMTMMERDVVAQNNTMAVASIGMSTYFKSTTEHLVTKVKVVDAVGAPVVGASVVGNLVRGATSLKVNWPVLTDAAGEAIFDYFVNKKALTAGTYTFTVNSVTKTDLVLSTPLPMSQSFVK